MGHSAIEGINRVWSAGFTLLFNGKIPICFQDCQGAFLIDKKLMQGNRWKKKYAIITNYCFN